MKIDNNKAIMLIELAKKYLDENVERFNEQEKKDFMNKLLENIKGDQKFMYDEVYDFLLHYNLIDGVSRHQSFVRYLNKNYHPFYTQNVLDVGAGRLCKLSARMNTYGFNMTAMDPNIRILESETRDLNIHISRNLFLCDEFAKENKGTDISSFDLIVGLEPCLGTEHIVRQGLKYEKPFEVVLCYEAHAALNGQKFKTVDDWFEHLLKISSELEIIKNKEDYIIRHIDHQLFLEREINLNGRKDKPKQIVLPNGIINNVPLKNQPAKKEQPEREYTKKPLQVIPYKDTEEEDQELEK